MSKLASASSASCDPVWAAATPTLIRDAFARFGIAGRITVDPGEANVWPTMWNCKLYGTLTVEGCKPHELFPVGGALFSGGRRV